MTLSPECILDIGRQILAAPENVAAIAQSTVDQLQPALLPDGAAALWLMNESGFKLEAAAGHNPPFAPGQTRPAAVSPPLHPTELALPLYSGGQLVGLLSLHPPRPNAFSPATIDHVQTLTGFLAAALANALRLQQTERELAQYRELVANIRQSEELFRQVAASVSAHIYVSEVTRDNVVLNHYIATNVEVLTSYPHENFIKDWGFWANTVIYPDDRQRAANQFNRLRQGLPSTTEYRLTRADGQIIWVRDSGRVELRGDSKFIYGVVTDITDRKLAELALEDERMLLSQRVAERTSELSAANAKLARAARLKDEFLANMSHELRTPLNAILGMSEVLQSGVYGQLNDEQLNAARHIEESGAHLLALITDILDLSKIEAEKLDLDISQVFIDYVCEASLRMVAQIAKKKRIKVTSQFDVRVKSIQADQRRLKQILVNLLSNAVKFTPEGGQVGLYVQGDRQHELARFVVWDTGVGIAAEDLPQLFQPFVQLDSRLSRQHEGTGLGLSLVARLSELHGGGVSVESEVGRGSRFTVSLPWREPEPVDDDPAEPLPGFAVTNDDVPPPAEKMPPLILLVEDNEANVITLTEFLTSLEYRVIVARNGIEAISRAQEERPDIVLMDIQMPGMDGLEALRRIRANDSLASLPVIALTALAMPGDRERCLEAGANDYLSKPVSLRRLAEVIKNYLQSVSPNNDGASKYHPDR